MEAVVEMVTAFGDGIFPEALRYEPGTPAYRSV